MYNRDMNSLNKTSGILLPITSLPSKYGIGDLGKEAYKFVDLLESFKAKAWQILPLGPVGYGNSPYASKSSFAGNEMLIDIESLIEEDLLPLDVTYDIPNFNQDVIEYEKVQDFKMNLLIQASNNFINYEDHRLKSKYEEFKKESFWLEDYALYKALTDYYNDSRWYMVFEKDLAKRRKPSIRKWMKKLSKEVEVYKILQFFFDYQYSKLKEYTNSKNIKIIGDIPIFVASDSCDAWANRTLFKINANCEQEAGSGVPPDAFSSEGQFWGNPVYKWVNHKKNDYKWWKDRIRTELKRCDLIRLDHFRGFESYWEIPKDATSAKEGVWRRGPRQHFFDSMKKEFKNLPFIAEDLGVITDKVNKLREYNNLCGMKILQFAFEYKDGKLNANHMYLPHNYENLSIAYTGTHDNDTSRGWYNSLDEKTKDVVRQYFETNDEDCVWQMIRSLFLSNSKMVIIPMQDILNLDSNFRINKPSTCNEDNWSYRFNYNHLQDWQIARYRKFVELYNRDEHIII